MEFKVRNMKEITKTDENGETETTYQYKLEEVSDDEVTITLKTPDPIDFLQPSSTVELKALTTQTTVETHADKKKS